MSAEAIASRPTLLVPPGTPSLISPNAPEQRTSPYSTVREARKNHQIISPQGVSLASLMGTDGISQFELINDEIWTLAATPHETFMGTDHGADEASSNFPFKHMYGFVRYLEYLQVKGWQLGNGDRTQITHAKAAHFLAGNWRFPRATEIEMPNGKMLDFAGLTPQGKIAVVDITSSARRESDISDKMFKLYKIYIPQLKKLHREAYGVGIKSSHFIPYVVTYDYPGDIKSLVVYDLEDVRELRFVHPDWEEEWETEELVA